MSRQRQRRFMRRVTLTDRSVRTERRQGTEVEYRVLRRPMLHAPVQPPKTQK
ncbi:MAG: hypothetical protein JW940_00530 [Polyangiaceae bacterium]|nr:hypothetical protein [Polyangiaceae bacterium]